LIKLETFLKLADAPIGAFSPKPTSTTAGQVEASAELWASADGSTKIGLWECTPGHFTADRTQMGEYCHIISGSASVTNHDGSGTKKIGAGDLLVLPAGWKGEWVIHDHIRKLYIMDIPKAS
jgi:uncharacterized cupin superfamily protein